MKKVLSILALMLSSALSTIVIYLLAYLVFWLISYVYSASRALFWVIVIGGGSFGLGLFWFLIPLAASLVISLSQKISLSKKGTRYTVMGVIIILYYSINTLLIVLQGNYTGITMVYTVVGYVLNIIFSIILIVHGRETAQEEYVAVSETNTVGFVDTSNYESNSIPVEGLKTLKDLHDAEVISDEEYELKKRQLLDI